jgi:endoglucanase
MRSFAISGLVLMATAAACGSKSSSGDNTSGSGSTASETHLGVTSSTSNASGSGSSGTTASTSSSSTVGGTGDGGPGTSLPALHVQGAQIVDANGKTVVLRGVAIPDIGLLFSEGGGIAGVTGRIDEILGAAGLDVRAIRLPVYPRTVVNSGSPTYSPVPYPVGPSAPGEAGAGMEMSASDYVAQVLQPAVDYATSKNLYAIVDYHQIDNVTTGTSSADAVTFWTAVAPVFAGYSNVLYEAFNEPVDNKASAGVTAAGAWTAAFTTAAQSWISTIRTGAPNNVIIVGSPVWSQYPDGALTAGLTGGNLVFTAHIYPGNWPGSMNAFQTRVANAAMSEPVAITEWGYEIGTASAFNNLATPNDTWAQSLQTFVNSGGESWTAWVADPSWGPPMFTKATGTDVNAFNSLNDFGMFVQTWLAGGTGSSDGGTEQ